MNGLWLLSQTDATDYDTYDSCVVCAEDEEEAKSFHPSAINNFASLEEYIFPRGWSKRGYSSWASEPSLVTARWLGHATGDLPKGVVCASFNAG